jgi:hypothetical protein
MRSSTALRARGRGARCGQRCSRAQRTGKPGPPHRGRRGRAPTASRSRGVGEDDVRVRIAVHVEVDQGRRLVEAAQDQPEPPVGLDRAAGRAGRGIRLPHG